MMIEPPRQAFVRTVFEIDDSVLVPVELFPVERIARPMHRRRVPDLGIRVDRSTVKFGKNGGRRNTVETVAVIEYPKFHMIAFSPVGKTY